MRITRRGWMAGALAAYVFGARKLLAETAGERAIDAAQLGGDVAYAVMGADGVVAGQNLDMLMPPASVTKAVTALFALERLGPEHRFTTRVMAVGVREGTVLRGDLILVGGGDPSLDTDRLGDLAAALAATGLREVTGRYYFYEGALPYRAQIAAGQPDYVGYNPAINGLLLNYNRVNFAWSARKGGGWDTQMNAEGTRFIPKVAGAEVTIVQREAPLFAYEGEAPVERWSVSADSLGKGRSRWLPLRHPGAMAAEVFGILCAAQGVTLGAGVQMAALPQDATVLVQDTSAPLTEILRGMLKFSTNITAEVVGIAASGAGAQSAQVMTDWAQHHFGVTAVFVDHSGLGEANQCSARDMVRMLSGAAGRPNGVMLMGLMRESGTFDADGREIKDSPLRVHSKSGTLNFVSALAGYIGADGTVFAIFAADVARRAAVPMEEREDPPGGSAWNKRARKMQRQLISGWAARL